MYNKSHHKFLETIFDNGDFKLSSLPTNEKYLNTVYRYYNIHRQRNTNNFLFIWCEKTQSSHVVYLDGAVGWDNILSDIEEFLNQKVLNYNKSGSYRPKNYKSDWIHVKDFSKALYNTISVDEILTMGKFENLDTIVFEESCDNLIVELDRHKLPKIQNVVFESRWGSECFFKSQRSLNFIFENHLLGTHGEFIRKNKRRNNIFFIKDPQRNIINNKINYPGTVFYPLKSFIGETDTDRIKCESLVYMCVTEMMMLMDRKVIFNGKTTITYNDDRDLKYINRFLKKQKIKEWELIKTNYTENLYVRDFYNINVKHYINEPYDTILVLGYERFNLTIKSPLKWEEVEKFFITHIDCFLNGFTVTDETSNNVFREFCIKTNNVKLLNKINEKYYQSKILGRSGK